MVFQFSDRQRKTSNDLGKPLKSIGFICGSNQNFNAENHKPTQTTAQNRGAYQRETQDLSQRTYRDTNVPFQSPSLVWSHLGPSEVSPQEAWSHIGQPGGLPRQVRSHLEWPGIATQEVWSHLGLPGVTTRQVRSHLEWPGMATLEMRTYLGRFDVSPRQVWSHLGWSGVIPTKVSSCSGQIFWLTRKMFNF